MGHVAGFGAVDAPERPRARRRTKEGWQERRARMRVEGAKLVAQYGLGRVSICDVAAACGIPRGSAYYYFDGWEELLTEIVDAHVMALHEQVGAADEAYEGHSPEVRLEAVTLAFLEVMRAQETEHRVQFAALHALPPGVAEGLRRKHRWLAARIGEVIAAVVPEIAERPEVLVPAAMSFMSLASSSVLWFRDGKGMSRAEYARMLAAMVAEGARRMAAA